MWHIEGNNLAKQKKRDMYPYPALRKDLNLRSRQDEIEVDYINKLSKKEKEWLNKFNSEYVNADLDRDNLENNIHNTKSLKSKCDKRNNERRKCGYTRSKAARKLDHIDDFTKEIVIENYEDMLIKKIDKSNKKKKVISLKNTRNKSQAE